MLRTLTFLLVLSLAGCATEITRKHFRMSFGDSSITNATTKGGSVSDGATKVAGQVVDAGVKAVSMLPGVSPPAPTNVTVEVVDERADDDEDADE